MCIYLITLRTGGNLAQGQQPDSMGSQNKMETLHPSININEGNPIIWRKDIKDGYSTTDNEMFA
jgi:hypothetical protein